MSLSAAVLDALVEAGASREQIIAAMKADIAEREAEAVARLEAKRDSNRDRQRRKRLKDNASSRDVTRVTRDSRDTPPKERKSNPPVPICSDEQKSPDEMPAWLPVRPWADFIEMRLSMGKRVLFTDAAKRGVIAKLGKLRAEGHDPAELLSEAVLNGWRGVFAPKPKPSRDPPNYLDHAIEKHRVSTG